MRCTEAKKMMKQINSDISAAAKEMEGGSFDILSEMNDAFSSTSKTVSEMKLQKKRSRPAPSMPLPEPVETTPSEEPMDPKKARVEELKRKALLMANRKKKRGSEISDTSSVVSDMSYQSDIAGPFITTTKEPKKRPATPERVNPKLEPVAEERQRCMSPKIRNWNPLEPDHGLGVYEDRLSAYLEEMQDALDFVEGIQEMVKGQNDLKQIEEFKETCDQALEKHVELCETLGQDVIDCNLQADSSILALEMYVGACDKEFEISGGGGTMIAEIQTRLAIEGAEPEEIEQPAI